MSHMTIDQKKRVWEGASIAETVRKRIESGGERAWRLADFDGLPFTAVAKTLSRLVHQGVIQRLGKGLYYRPQPTSLGLSRPNITQAAITADPAEEDFSRWGRGGQRARLHDAEFHAGGSGDGQS